MLCVSKLHPIKKICYASRYTVYISRYITKFVYQKKSKRLIICNGRSNILGSSTTISFRKHEGNFIKL